MSPAARSSLLPVVLVGGMHGDARRVAVQRLLEAVPGSLALHHDLSEAARRLLTLSVRDARGVLATGQAPLVNDCACCALRAGVVPELTRFADDGACTLAVVELWDSVEHAALAEVIGRHSAGRLRLAGVVTAVDPALALPALGCADDLSEAGMAAAPTDRRTIADTWARQLEYAQVLAVVEGAEPADAAELALLSQLHPTAHLVSPDTPGFAALALAGFDVEAAAARQHPATALLPQESDASGVATFVWRHRRPFHPERLYAALEELTCAAPRSRGRFWLADRPDTLLSWDAAGSALCVDNAGPWLAALPDAAWEMVPPARRAAASVDWHEECGDRVQHLVFTGPALDAVALRGLLESCLLTDAEFAAGRESWRRLGSAFDRLLDPAF